MHETRQCFKLSDEGIEATIYDSQAIRGFVGVELNHESASDATTLSKLSRLLETNGLAGQIVDAINGQLAREGIRLLAKSPACAIKSSRAF